jgi:hypothetical protein
MWSICVVFFPYYKHFTWVENVKGYTFGEKKILDLDVLLNSTGCYCKLTTTAVDFITNRGGTNKSIVEFVISNDYLKLRIDADISLLDNSIEYLSTDALDFFRLWYTHNHMS